MSDYNEHLISMAGGDGELDLAVIEARATAATDGPWEPEPTRAGDYMPYYGVKSLAKGWNVVHARVDWEGFGHGSRQADAEFIAHARADVPALLAMVREQRAVLDAVQKLMQAAWDGQTYVLPGGYPSRPVEAFDLRAALATPEQS